MIMLYANETETIKMYFLICSVHLQLMFFVISENFFSRKKKRMGFDWFVWAILKGADTDIQCSRRVCDADDRVNEGCDTWTACRV